jgi:hypothetical protein
MTNEIKNPMRKRYKWVRNIGNDICIGVSGDRYTVDDESPKYKSIKQITMDGKRYLFIENLSINNLKI